MSYFDSLSSWQNAGNSIQSQQQASEQENRDQKAEGIEDKFAYVDKVMGEVGGGVGGFGGGFHIARKVFKKAKSLQAKAKEAKEAIDKARGATKPEPDGEGSKTPAEHTDKPNGTEDSTSEPSSAGDGRNPPAQEEPKAESKNANDEPETSTKTEEPKADEDFPEAPEVPDKPSTQIKDAPDVPESAKPPAPSEQNVGEKGDSEDLGNKGELPEKEDLNVSEQASDAKVGNFASKSKVSEKPSLETIEEPKFGESETDTGGMGQGSDGMPRMGTNPTAEDQLPIRPAEVPKPEAPTLETNTSGADDISNTISDLKGQASDIADRVSSLASKAKNMVSNTGDLADGGASALKEGVMNAGKKVAGKVGEEGVAEAGGVLDFLGPAGEILGAGLALGSFFHDLIEHHREQKKIDDAKGATGNIAQNTGISMASIQSAGNKSNVVGTIV